MSQTKKERDQFLKDRNDFYEKYVDLLSKKDQIENQRNDYRKDFQLATQERKTLSLSDKTRYWSCFASSHSLCSFNTF
jgi:hypothetical protein